MTLEFHKYEPSATTVDEVLDGMDRCTCECCGTVLRVFKVKLGDETIRRVVEVVERDGSRVTFGSHTPERCRAARGQ